MEVILNMRLPNFITLVDHVMTVKDQELESQAYVMAASVTAGAWGNKKGLEAMFGKKDSNDAKKFISDFGKGF